MLLDRSFTNKNWAMMGLPPTMIWNPKQEYSGLETDTMILDHFSQGPTAVYIPWLRNQGLSAQTIPGHIPTRLEPTLKLDILCTFVRTIRYTKSAAALEV